VDRLLNKLDQLDERLHSIDVTLAKQEVNLQEHMRRTELLEAEVNDVRASIEPVQDHVKIVNGILKFIGFLALLVGLATGLLKLLASL
jgi:chromosome segregation ATPase